MDVVCYEVVLAFFCSVVFCEELLVDTRLVVYICISDGYLLVEVCQVYLLAKVI